MIKIFTVLPAAKKFRIDFIIGLLGILFLVTGTAGASAFKKVEVIGPLCKTTFQTSLM